MANHIKRVKTTSGNEQIDYTALANLPLSDTSLSIAGRFADALVTGNVIYYLDNYKADYITKSTEGIYFNLTDSANAILHDMHVMGKSVKTDSGFSNVIPKAECLGGNLLPYPYRNSTVTQYGITFTDNGDGSISLIGTSTGEANFILYNGDVIVGGNYLSGCESDGSYSLIASDGTSVFTNITGYTPISDVKQVYITVKSGVTVNAVVNPMVSYNPIDYERYKALVTFEVDIELLGVPVTENGNYIDENGQMWICDELDCKEKKYIQRIGVIESYAGQSINTSYLSSSDGLNVGDIVYYVLSEPIETDIDLDILRSYCPITTIRSNPYLTITYATDLKNYIDQNYVSKELFNELVIRVENLEA